MVTAHPHAAVIKAWADGAEIQCRKDAGEHWQNLGTHEADGPGPAWHVTWQYRVKPTLKEVEHDLMSTYKLLDEHYPSFLVFVDAVARDATHPGVHAAIDYLTRSNLRLET